LCWPIPTSRPPCSDAGDGYGLININGMGILESHQGLGGNALLYAELYRILIDHPQYDFADLVQIQETNQRIFQETEAIGVKAWKVHRMFQRSLGQDPIRG